MYHGKERMNFMDVLHKHIKINKYGLTVWLAQY